MELRAQMCVRIEGDVSNGISCYLFRVSSLCPLVLPGFQNTQGSGRNQTVHHHRTLKEGGLREDGPLQPRASVILSGKKKKKNTQEIRRIFQIIPRLNI